VTSCRTLGKLFKITVISRLMIRHLLVFGKL